MRAWTLSIIAALGAFAAGIGFQRDVLDDGVSVDCAAAYGAFWRTWYETERFVDADISQDAYWWLTHDICGDDYGRVHDVGLSASSYLTHRAIGMTESPFTDNPFAQLEAP